MEKGKLGVLDPRAHLAIKDIVVIQVTLDVKGLLVCLVVSA